MVSGDCDSAIDKVRACLSASASVAAETASAISFVVLGFTVIYLFETFAPLAFLDNSIANCSARSSRSLILLWHSS